MGMSILELNSKHVRHVNVYMDMYTVHVSYHKGAIAPLYIGIVQDRSHTFGKSAFP